MNAMNRKYISSTSLELGLVTSSILQLSVNKNTVNNEEGLWPYVARKFVRHFFR